MKIFSFSTVSAIAMSISIINATQHQNDGMIVYARNAQGGDLLNIEVDSGSNIQTLSAAILEHPQCGISGVTPNQLLISLAGQDIITTEFEPPSLADVGICAESVVEFRVNPQYQLSEITIILWLEHMQADRSRRYYTQDRFTADIPPVVVGNNNFLQQVQQRACDWLLESQRGTAYAAETPFDPRSATIAFNITDNDFSGFRYIATGNRSCVDSSEFQIKEGMNAGFVTKDYINYAREKHPEFAEMVGPSNLGRVTVNRQSCEIGPDFGEIRKGPLLLSELFNMAQSRDVRIWHNIPEHYYRFSVFIDIVMTLPSGTTLLFGSEN